MSDSHTSPLIAGVELGGTKIVCLLASGPEQVVEEVRIPTTGPDEVFTRIGAVLARWRAEHGFAALGVASFGPLELDPRSPRYGQVVATTKPGWDGADLNRLGRALATPVMIDTDVNGAACAEGLWGAARDLRSYAYVTVGTGIGVGSIIEGRAVRGLGHSEAGHQKVGRLPGDLWPGICSYHGDCVEGLASGPAIAARAGRSGADLDPEDPAWDGVVHALAGLMHNLVLTAAPERILIGGGVADGQAWLFPRLRRALAESLNGYGVADRIVAQLDAFVQPPGLGDRAGPLGPIALGRAALVAARKDVA